MFRQTKTQICLCFRAFVIKSSMCLQTGQSLEYHLDTPKRRLLKYAVFFRTEFESVYT